jgi:hypothetical protein
MSVRTSSCSMRARLLLTSAEIAAWAQQAPQAPVAVYSGLFREVMNKGSSMPEMGFSIVRRGTGKPVSIKDRAALAVADFRRIHALQLQLLWPLSD